jgi:hypothetical protein
MTDVERLKNAILSIAQFDDAAPMDICRAIVTEFSVPSECWCGVPGDTCSLCEERSGVMLTIRRLRVSSTATCAVPAVTIGSWRYQAT